MPRGEPEARRHGFSFVRLAGKDNGFGRSGRMTEPGDQQRRSEGRPGQGLVEFMLVLPVLLLIVLGVIEAGRMLLIYSGMTSASREASRYGATVGDNGSGTPRYLDCLGMRDAARRVATLTTLADADIQIVYDHGDPTLPIASCDANPHPNQINLGDRVVVTVSTVYQPIVPLVPLPPMTITTSTGRTILTEVAAGPTVTLGGPTSTTAPTDTSVPPTAGPSPTPEDTPTPTVPPTDTPGPSPTPTITNTIVPSPTPIPPPTNLTVTCLNGKLSFNWSVVSGAHSYNIYRLVDGSPLHIAIDSNPACNNCGTMSSGESGVFYATTVVLSRESAPSNLVSVTCP